MIYTIRVMRDIDDSVDIQVKADSERDARMIAFALDGGMGNDYPCDDPSILCGVALTSWTKVI